MSPVEMPKRPAAQGPLHEEFGRADTLPYRPAEQLVHTPDPATLYRPAGHTAAVSLVDPEIHAYPAVQLPKHSGDDRPAVDPKRPAGHGAVQLALGSPVVDPYRPAAQSVHSPDPDTLYFPTGHTAAVADTDACTQMYPALQLPLHTAVDRPLVPPYSPAAQSTHAPHPDSEYRPGGHTDAVALVDPATHTYPAVQLAVQLDTDKPDADPYRPASHGPLQAAVDMAVVAPNSPALQLVQTPAPARLYVPSGQVTAVGTMDAGGHA